MEAKLNIYGSCEDDKPIKTYVARRLTMRVSVKALALKEKMKDKNDEEVLEYLLDFFQAIFPEFTQEDLEGVDPQEIWPFVNALQSNASSKFDRAQKN